MSPKELSDVDINNKIFVQSHSLLGENRGGVGGGRRLKGNKKRFSLLPGDEQLFNIINYILIQIIHSWMSIH